MLPSLDDTTKAPALAALKDALWLSCGGVLLLTLICAIVVIMKWRWLRRFCARRGSQAAG